MFIKLNNAFHHLLVMVEEPAVIPQRWGLWQRSWRKLCYGGQSCEHGATRDVRGSEF